MTTPDTAAAIEVVQKLRTELSHVLLGNIDASVLIDEALKQVNANEAIRTADAFIDAAVWGEKPNEQGEI